MSMRHFLKMLVLTPTIFMVGACSFKKNPDKKEKQIITVQETQKTPSQFCADIQSESKFDDSQLLPLSTSTNEADLCKAIKQFISKADAKTLIPNDIKVFNNILSSAVAVAGSKDAASRSTIFKSFSSWATGFAASQSNADLQTLIKFNNGSSNHLNNIQIITDTLLTKKIYLFIDTDHLSQQDFQSYFDAVGSKVDLINLCTESAVQMTLKSKRLSAHTSSIIETCRSNVSASDLISSRVSLMAPVSEAELLFLTAAIEGNLVNLTTESTFSKIAASITRAVKINDLNLLKMAVLVFANTNKILQSLAMSKEVGYDLEGFIKNNSRGLFPIIQKLWNAEEVLSSLQNRQSSILFKAFSEQDIIPDKSQSEQILKQLINERKLGERSIDTVSLESFFKLLKSNTYTGFFQLKNVLSLADEELNLIAGNGKSSLEIASILGVGLNSYSKIYLKASKGGMLQFSQTQKENFYMSGALFQQVFLSATDEISDKTLGIAFEDDQGETYYLPAKDVLTLTLTDLSSKIQCRADNNLNACKAADENVVKSLLNVADYLKRHK
ncbi:hypothetical protein EZJ49_03610 [Bdellovibrio bacteriovorus]|uniref:hypothetical protein n=1 Tax=Bdellovibrio bacteriovorus TaxID=959 RepID=UPI0021CE65FB|nr:hypothetical protein [Bdellovibrio bacteriovorus]UXR65337.1 hypothetical protein EZJ49_03610 [Bdellovibrio bacteriovorus]